MVSALLVSVLSAGILLSPLTWADDGLGDAELPDDSVNAEETDDPASVLPEEEGVSPRTSRLNRLLIRSANLYMPSRLVLGEENKFVARAKPGQQVLIFISPAPSGLVLPGNGGPAIPLRVGHEYEQIVGLANEKGVAELTITLPDEKDWAGHTLYIDAISFDSASRVPARMDDNGQPVADVNPLVDLRTVTNAQQLDLLNASGQRTSVNALTMVPPASTGGAMVMPAMPGFSPQMLQQITTITEAAAGNEHKKNLLDDGTRSTDNALDRNALITRPGSIQPGLK